MIADKYLLEEDSASDILAPHDGPPPTDERPKGRHVLAIDDSREHFELIEHYLRLAAHVDVQVTHAVRLVDALRHLSHEPVDVVLLNLNLPDCEGLQTLRLVLHAAPQVPVVVLASKDDEPVAIEAVREGAEDFLTKGEFDGTLLVRSIRYAIARHRSRVNLQRALEAKRISEQNFHNVISNNMDGMVVVDKRGIIQFLNPAAEALFGRSAAKLLQTPFGFPLTCSEPSVIEIQRDDGQCTPVEMRSVDVNWQGEGSSLAVLRDLTSRKQAQAEHARLMAIVQSTENAIVSTDLTGTLLTWNPAAETMFGYTAEEAIGEPISMLWPLDQCKEATEIIELVKRGGTISQLETIRRRKDGSTIDVSLSVFPIRNEEEEVVGLGSIVADISDRTRTQKELEEKKIELRSAQAIQQRLLPQAPPKVSGFDIAAGLFPAAFAAGDYYDVLPMGEGAMGFVVGDVSSHGLGPAMLMATTCAYLRSFARAGHDLGQILGCLNQVLIDETKDEDFVTLLFAQLDCQARSLVYSSAGHSTGYILDSSGRVTQELPSTTVPLAVLPDAEFPVRGPVQLMPGDTVFFPTDGLHEARAPDGRFLGKETMLEVVRVNRNRSAEEIVHALHHFVCEFCQREDPTDDLTVVVVKVDASD